MKFRMINSVPVGKSCVFTDKKLPYWLTVGIDKEKYLKPLLLLKKGEHIKTSMGGKIKRIK